MKDQRVEGDSKVSLVMLSARLAVIARRDEGVSLGRHSLICCDSAVLTTRYVGN